MSRVCLAFHFQGVCAEHQRITWISYWWANLHPDLSQTKTGKVELEWISTAHYCKSPCCQTGPDVSVQEIVLGLRDWSFWDEKNATFPWPEAVFRYSVKEYFPSKYHVLCPKQWDVSQRCGHHGAFNTAFRTLSNTLQSICEGSRQALCTAVLIFLIIKTADAQVIFWRIPSCRDQLCTAQGKGERRCNVRLINGFVIFNLDYPFSPFHFPCRG